MSKAKFLMSVLAMWAVSTLLVHLMNQQTERLMDAITEEATSDTEWRFRIVE